MNFADFCQKHKGQIKELKKASAFTERELKVIKEVEAEK